MPLTYYLKTLAGQDSFAQYGFTAVWFMNMAGNLATDDWPEGEELTWWHFQNEDSAYEAYSYDIGDDAYIWTMQTLDDGDNVENVITMAGAVTMAATASALALTVALN